jgi:hypothetical protein
MNRSCRHWIAWSALAALAGCSPASIGITGPGAQANRPEIKPLHNDAALPTVGVPNDLNGYAPSAVPTTGPGGRYYGY